MPGRDLPIVRKAVGYIVDGDRLLVFEHVDHPEAGLQVPAGTLQVGELPEAGVLREASEETGLSGLSVVSFLGRHEYDARPYRDELHDRYVFQLALDHPAPATWIHHELHDGLAPATAFRFFWIPVSKAASQLAAGQDKMLGLVRLG